MKSIIAGRQSSSSRSFRQEAKPWCSSLVHCFNEWNAALDCEPDNSLKIRVKKKINDANIANETI